MIYRAGQYTLNTDSLELEISGSPVLVEPRVFQLLQFLIENRDRVVSRDDIAEAVWNGRIVSDSALTYALNEARRIVGDDGKTQGIIRTLPRRGLRFVADATEEFPPNPKSPNPVHAAPSDMPSIAVMAFENMSGDPEQDYFSDGMAEDLITDISKISGLFVVARNSSFAFRGHTVDVKEIAEKLGVRHILEGSVRKMGTKLRVNAQLIDAASGGHIWAERYDGDMADIFGFQGRYPRAHRLRPSGKADTSRQGPCRDKADGKRGSLRSLPPRAGELSPLFARPPAGNETVPGASHRVGPEFRRRLWLSFV